MRLPYDLADNGWRLHLRGRLVQLAEQRNRKLNTPKAENIQDLFRTAVGLTDISTAWRWKRMSSAEASKKLDKYVALRGDIAHRGKAAGTCRKAEVTSYFGHIKKLVGKTGGRVNAHVKSIVGKGLW